MASQQTAAPTQGPPQFYPHSKGVSRTFVLTDLCEEDGERIEAFTKKMGIPNETLSYSSRGSHVEEALDGLPGICKKETPDYLILWVLAHGGVNTDDNLEYVLTKDSDKILVNTILERLSGTKLPQMDGKPKVVIILACRGESCNIAGFSEVLSPEVLMGRSQSNTGSSMCIRIPNISDMYILQSTVTGTISLSKNPFIERIVDGLTHGKDIETVAKTLVWDAKQQGSKKFHVNKEKHGSEKSEERNGEPKQTFLIPERKSTLESAFRVTVQSFESE